MKALLLLSLLIHQSSAFSRPFAGFSFSLDQLLGAPSERDNLKSTLLEACQDGSNDRAAIESIIQQLCEYNPTTAAAASPLLQKKWMLTWTTEKEINFFLDQGFSPAGSIYQIIDGTNLENNIPLGGSRSFGVQGDLSVPDPAGPRTEFVFRQANLDLGPRWGSYSFPPVGQGWFDTVYLDDTLRVDVNSRDDILICTPAKE